jgi:starvation-inducible DNA-binding protein
MEELIQGMKIALANAYALQLKAQNYHWNVEGPDFVQYHKLFGELYQEISDSVDVFAEEIRALGAYTPGSFSRFTELSQIADEIMVADAMTMISRTLQDLNTCKAQLIPLFELSEQSKTYGLSDFIAGRIDALSKHIWMFSATMKR